MRISEIVARIEKRIPKSWAEPWDNPGLLAGRTAADAERIAVALDATPAAVARAAELGCGLLVTHHPVIFRPIKSLSDESLAGRAIIDAIEKGVALYAVHTNWDSSPEGVNFILAGALGLSGIAPLVPSGNGAWGLGAAGNLPRALSPGALCEFLREKWKLSAVSLYGDRGRDVRRVAIGGGACMDLWPEAASSGVQCFITADVTYHPREEALDAGLAVAVCDHGEMERFSMPALAAIVAEETGLYVTTAECGGEGENFGG